MSSAFANQVAVVTGASSGIGWELAKQLARAGARVGLIARRRDALEKLAQEISSASGTSVVAPADVSDRGQTLAAFQQVIAQLGPVDLLLANSGMGIETCVDPINSLDLDTMMRVNFLGVVYSIEAVLPEMLKRGHGHLAVVSSLAAYKGMPGTSGYAASKAAVNVYLEGLRVQLRRCGIAVTTICPGFVRTPMTVKNPWMPFLLEADEAARRILRAVRRRRKVYNFPMRTTLLIKLVRWLPDWFVDAGLRWLEGKP